MTTKEQIQAEIERISDEKDLNDLYQLVKEFSESRRNSKQSLMSRLRSITIDAPEEFSANTDKTPARISRLLDGE